MKDKPKVLIVGPYITNYSLAKVNRGFAVALAKVAPELDVHVWQEPDFPLDKLPTEAELKKFPELAKLLTNDVTDTDIVIMNHYPSSPQQSYGLANLPGKTKLMYLAWEETVFPEDKVQEINQNLHGLLVSSTFVKQIMRRNGVRVPIIVVPNAINDNLELKPAEFPLDTKKKFKFLHISTAKPRKGVDVLLKAYFEEFSGDDDVTLVIKSFPGPENIVNDLIGKYTKEHGNPPEIIHINNPDLTEQEIVNLTHTCDCAVYPTRAEGFGLPIAEAMFLKTPVITTGYGGHLDFIDADSGMLIPFKITPAVESESTNIGARWAEPDADALQHLMRKAIDRADPKRIERAFDAAKELTWENSALKAKNFIIESQDFTDLKRHHLAVLTTMNTVCGIAEYSKDLYTGILDSFAKVTYIANSDVADRTRPDHENVVRLWEHGEQNFTEVLDWLKEEQPDIFHIQLHAGGHFPLSGLNRLLDGINQLENPPRVVVTPHTVKSDSLDLALSKDYLEKVSKVLVHKQVDFDYLSSTGLSNLELFQLPFDEFPVRSQSYLTSRLGITNNSPVIISHGLVSSHKGLLQTARAISMLKPDYPEVLWLAVNAVNINNSTSASTFAELRETVAELGIEDQVRFFPEFLESEQVVALLQAADIGVLAYDERGESASAAVRKFLASGTPTIVTNIPMMGELHNEVLKINDNSPQAIAAGIRSLIEDETMAKEISKNALETSKAGNWDTMGIQLLKTYSKI